MQFGVFSVSDITRDPVSGATPSEAERIDAAADHHWPFTRERNASGRIEADRALAALDTSSAPGTTLILEVIPPFEQDDDEVVAELEESVAYWRAALARRP